MENGQGEEGFPENNIKNILKETEYNANPEHIRYFNSKTLEQLDIENIDDEIVINFSNKKVYSLRGIKYKEIKYYTQYELPGGQKINTGDDIPIDLNFTYKLETIGLNGKLTISNKSFKNGKIIYKLINEIDPSSEQWIKTNKDIIDITKSGKYILKLSDNAGNFSEEKTVNIMLYNYPIFEEDMIGYYYDENSYIPLLNNKEKSNKYNYSQNEEGEFDEEKFAISKKEEELYLKFWIPRFCYIEIDGNIIIKFLKGTTNITTDNITIDENWQIPAILNENGKQVGIWVEFNGEINTINLLDII